MANATGRLVCWRLRVSEFELDVVHRAVIKHQEVDVFSRLPTSNADVIPTEEEISIAVIDTILNSEDEITLQHLYRPAETHFVEENEDLQEGPESAQTLEAFRRQQATDPFCQQAAQVANDKAVYAVERIDSSPARHRSMAASRY